MINLRDVIKKPIISHVLVILASVLAMLAWDHFKSQPAPIGEYTPAKESSLVRGVPKVTIPLPNGIKAYAPAGTVKLKLPESMKNTPVIAATECAPDRHPTTNINTVDPITGDVATVTRIEPYPWLKAINVSSVSLGYGIGSSGTVWALYGRKELFQIKGIDFGAQVMLTTDRAWGAQILGTYYFR